MISSGHDPRTSGNRLPSRGAISLSWGMDSPDRGKASLGLPGTAHTGEAALRNGEGLIQTGDQARQIGEQNRPPKEGDHENGESSEVLRKSRSLPREVPIFPREPLIIPFQPFGNQWLFGDPQGEMVFISQLLIFGRPSSQRPAATARRMKQRLWPSIYFLILRLAAAWLTGCCR